MSVVAVVGANWGDEGKGKLTDAFASAVDVVVRFQGGNNAGHTVINEHGRFALRLLPSGVFHRHVLNVLGPGVAVNIDALLQELEALTRAGVPAPRLLVSDRAQVVLPYHIALDEYEEARLGQHSFGSTRNGIAPFYSDKYLKIGIQLGDLFQRDLLVSKLTTAIQVKNVQFEHLYGKPPIDINQVVQVLTEQAERILPYVGDTHHALHQALQGGQRILLEGQLGALRDPDNGIYPFSTSSSPLAGFASVGAGIPPHAIDRIVAVVKAYSSCVGAGPLVTELHGVTGDALRSQGGAPGDHGSATNLLPLRVGWFDAVATRYGCQLQGATEIALTLLDVLGYLDEIPVCVRYNVNGHETDRFPRTPELMSATPVYEYLPGWRSDITGIRRYEDLPTAAKEYVAFIERSIGVKVRWLSVGPEREQLIKIS